LLATVFLIGAAILIGSIVMLSSFKSTEKVITIADQWVTARVLSFSARWPPLADCSSLCNSTTPLDDIECYDSGAAAGEQLCYCLLIENQESEVVNYNVITKGNIGAEVCPPENFQLEGLQSKVFAIAVHKTYVGDNSLTAEVSAVQSVSIPS